jgi:hypothetical protein
MDIALQMETYSAGACQGGFDFTVGCRHGDIEEAAVLRAEQVRVMKNGLEVDQ